jgi:dTDP-4-amino-4,6-dideoxygalactose transaminase
MARVRAATPMPEIFDANGKRREGLPVGQLYWPSWGRYEAAFRDIFERQYYTNHGPLARTLEQRLAAVLGVRHAICVSNATIGLMMLGEALGLRGKVITPAFTFIATAQALTWVGLEPVFCDVEPGTHQLDPACVEALIDPEVSAILPVNLWGDCCAIPQLQDIATRHGLRLFFDSAHGFGCSFADRPLGGFGHAEVFSFHATKVLSAAEGGCITTNDDALASKLRNIRSSYGAGVPVPVVKTSNARMSEAHAAIALLNLDEFPAFLDRNRQIFDSYSAGLSGIDGLRLHRPGRTSATNHQYIVCDVDEGAFGMSRDALLQHLQRHNIVARRYFYPGVHRCPPFNELPRPGTLPVTERLTGRLLQLPSGALVQDDDVRMICRIISNASRRQQ